MYEPQFVRVQSLPLYIRVDFSTVQRIPNQWVPQMGQMDPNLMGSPGGQGAMEQTHILVAGQTRHVGLSDFSWVPRQVHHRHAQTLARVSSNR
jgi:hypothetical protein